MGHPTADDEPNSFVPPGGLGEPPKGNVHDQIEHDQVVQIKLDDDMIVDMWLTSVRGALAGPVDPDTLRRLLSLSLDLIESLMEHIDALEKP